MMRAHAWRERFAMKHARVDNHAVKGMLRQKKSLTTSLRSTVSSRQVPGPPAPYKGRIKGKDQKG